MIRGLTAGLALTTMTLTAPPSATAGALGVRLTSSGTLDTTYGSGGYAWNATSSSPIHAAVDASGRTVVLSFGSGLGASLHRFTAAGTRDLTFGTNGQVTLGFPGYLGCWYGRVAVDASGRIVVATGAVYYSNRDGERWRLGLLRFDTSGRADTTFGGGAGYVVPITNDWPKNPTANALTVAPDGSIVVAGMWQRPTTEPPFENAYFMRVTSTGTLDTTFNNGGTQQILSPSYPVDVRVDTSGRLVAALASTFNGKQTVMLARFGALGLLDWGFGLQGIMRYSPSGYEATPRALILNGDKILVAGDARPSAGGSSIVLVERFNGNGFPDVTFDQDGIALAFAGSGDHVTSGLGFDKYGRIVVGATLTSRAAFLRFASNGTIDTTFGASGATVLPYPGAIYGMVTVRVEGLGQVRSVLSTPTAPPAPTK